MRPKGRNGRLELLADIVQTIALHNAPFSQEMVLTYISALGLKLPRAY